MTEHRRTAAAVVAVIVLHAACTSLPYKQRATSVLSIVHELLVSAQQAEIDLYRAGRPDDPLVPALTDAHHRTFHEALLVAFDAEERAAITLRAWRAGDPIPRSLPEILTASREALAVLQQVGPESTAGVLGHLTRAMAETEALIDLLLAAGRNPPALDRYPLGRLSWEASR